jgi:hypothetical protein
VISSSRLLACAAVMLVAAPVYGHELLLKYQLPVPFSTYLYASTATLVVTFVLLGWFMRASRKSFAGPAWVADATGKRIATVLVSDTAPVGERPIGRVTGTTLTLLRTAAVVMLGITIVAGLIGTRDPGHNISLAIFWQFFLLGWSYATAIIGDAFAFLNPWAVIVACLARRGVIATRPRYAYPAGLGYWPATAAYLILIWLELFTLPAPRMLATLLCAYTLVNVAGSHYYGKEAWFRYGELFSVLFRVIGLLAPVAYRPAHDGRGYEVRLRRPFAGVLEERADRMSLVLFVLFMLASTTYDGIHQTVFWMGLYWNHLLAWIHPAWSGDIASAGSFEKGFAIFQRVGLMAFPLFYLALYLGVLGIARAMTRTTLSLRTLALAFIFAIVPIALVYNMAHYYTLLCTQIVVLPYLLTDPLGYGWDIFRLGHLGEPPLLNMAAIWHTEVALILGGHVVSVYLAHRIALESFSSRCAAVVSQVPMLALMVGYTVVGLWVISLPIALTH